jgi:hypothetical protein
MSSLVFVVVAKPVGPNPGATWLPETIWGTKLRLENGAYFGEAWFGATAGYAYVVFAPSPPTDYMRPVFVEGITEYDQIVRAQVIAPQSYSWYVKLDRGGAAPANGTLSCEFENAEAYFVPPDFSVVLENLAQGIFVNLREENGYITGLPKYATLYADNAVNIESIENLDPLCGNVGDTLRLNVTVRNTGRYTDTYDICIEDDIYAFIDLLDPGESATEMVTTTIPGGTENIIITAAGIYATDTDYVTATEISAIVLQGFDSAYNRDCSGIAPWENYENEPPEASNPPVMVADEVGSGAVAAAGIARMFPYNIWYRWVSPNNLPGLLDETFQWMVPDAAHVLWYEGYGVYNDASICSEFIKALGSYALFPTDDAHVIDGASSGNNYGSLGAMYVGTYWATGENDRAFLKFDLSGIPAKENVSSAILHTHDYNGTSASPIVVSAYEVDNDDWTEGTITWYNAPWADVGAKLDSDLVPTVEVWNEWDVTSFVINQFAVDNVASILLRSENEGVPESVAYDSKESIWLDPGELYLEITYAEENVWNEDLGENYPIGGAGLGYKVYADNAAFENADLSYRYDIVVIPQLRLGDSGIGGDPALLPDVDVSALNSFVTGGGGLLVAEQSDYGGYNYCRVQNKILSGLNFGWWFQHDQVNDNVNNDYASYLPQIEVNTCNPIGSDFYGATGFDNIEGHEMCALIQEPAPETPEDVYIFQGMTFPLSYTLKWWDPNNPGAYRVSIYWDCNGNKRHEDFTFVSASAYFDNGDNIRADIYIAEGPVPGDPSSTRYTLSVVDYTFTDNRNGQFYVDIWLRATGSGGILHIPTDNHPIFHSDNGVWVAEGAALIERTPSPITVSVLEWPYGGILYGKDNAYNINQTGIEPYVYYGDGVDFPAGGPLIMAAERAGGGALVAAGFAATCRNDRWNDENNPFPHLDQLLDITFQWMKPGAENVLWYQGHNVYNDNAKCSLLIEALENLGYNVTADNFEPITNDNLLPYDIVVIPQLQLGAGENGGDPALLLDNEVQDLKKWVKNENGGLLVLESSDFGGYNFCRVQNKILEAFNSDRFSIYPFNWLFQHDQVNDNINNWENRIYKPLIHVDNATSLGLGYQGAKDTTQIGLYSICSLVHLPPEPYLASPYPSDDLYGPSWLPLISGPENLSAVDLKESPYIISATFEYSTDGENWVLIGTDNNPEPEVEPLGFGLLDGISGWNAEWDVSSLPENLYLIKVTMLDNFGQDGEDIFEVYYDPTPPTPTFMVEPIEDFSYAEISCKFEFGFDTIDEDVQITKLEYLDTPDDNSGCKVHTGLGRASQWDVGPSIHYENINGRYYYRYVRPWINPAGRIVGTTALSRRVEISETTWKRKGAENCRLVNGYCTPTAAANSLWRLGLANPDLTRGFDNATELAKHLARKMGTHPRRGTFTWMEKDGVRSFLRQENLGCDNDNGYTVCWSRPTRLYRWYVKKMKKGEDVTVGVYGPGYGHSLTGRDYWVGRRWRGRYFAPKISLSDPGGTPRAERIAGLLIGRRYICIDNKLRKLKDLMWISPKNDAYLPGDPPEFVLIDVDNDPSDNWSASWDTHSVKDGFYLMRATMIDNEGNTGAEDLLVWVNNEPPSPQFVAPTDGDLVDLVLQNHQTAEVFVEVIDSKGSQDIAYCEFSYFDWNSCEWELIGGDDDIRDNFSVYWDISSLPDCEYYLRARMEDFSENLPVENIIKVRISRSPPQVCTLISPSFQSGLPGENLTYTVTVVHKENVENTYFLTASDTLGWGLTLYDNLLVIPENENQTTTLEVRVPNEAEPGVVDCITVTATSKADPLVSDSYSCIAHASKADLELENMYKVGLEKDLLLDEGSKLVVKFYKYDDTFQTESVINEFVPPYYVENIESVPHPRGEEGFPWGTVQIAKLMLTTDNTEEVISTLAGLTVHQSDLRNRYIQILLDWAGCPACQPAFKAEIIDILLQWASAPP